MPQETEFIEELKEIIKNYMFWHNYGIRNLCFIDIEDYSHIGINALKRLRNCCIFNVYNVFELETALLELSQNHEKVNAEIKGRIKLIAEGLEKYKAKYEKN